MLPSGKAIFAATSSRRGKSVAASRGSKAAQEERIEAHQIRSPAKRRITCSRADDDVAIRPEPRPDRARTRVRETADDPMLL